MDAADTADTAPVTPRHLDRAAIAARIPHQGSMCLLDQVTDWNEHEIRCTARSHRGADNPLRAHGRLASVCGIEYAAQAMAIHGALLAQTTPDSTPRAGYLTSVRSVSLAVATLDDLADDLHIEAERLSGSENTVLYAFRVACGERELISGRASVVLDADTLAPRP